MKGRTVRSIVFLIDLVQDVGALRDVMRLACSVKGNEVIVLRSARFATADKLNLWQAELTELCKGLSIPVIKFDTELAAIKLLTDRYGLLISASESSVPSHSLSHGVFAGAPSGFLRITFQHGFECVGFLHNRAHDDTYGRSVRFNADVVAGWCDMAALTALLPAERPKLYVTGPPATTRPQPERRPGVSVFRGLICENLHSVRLKSTGVADEFLECVRQFAQRMSHAGGELTLRPHPTGQFLSTDAGRGLDDIAISALPIWRERLNDFAFAISAPSSVLIDLALAGIPVAVWQDSRRSVNLDNYQGLSVVTTVDDCWRFAVEALGRKASYLQSQTEFLAEIGFPNDAEARIIHLLHANVGVPA